MMFDRSKLYTYVDNTLIDSIFRKDIYETDIEFIKKMKTATQRKYNNR